MVCFVLTIKILKIDFDYYVFTETIVKNLKYTQKTSNENKHKSLLR